jgi:hypothetical protein
VDVFLQYVVEILLQEDCLMQTELVMLGTAASHGCDVLAGISLTSSA